MPCLHPLQASFVLASDGKKELSFNSSLSNASARNFCELGLKPSQLSDNIQFVPCGRCMGCRLEYSRQWAMRCMHEASLYDENCFITLTYNEESLPVNGSLDYSHFPLFMKRFREFYEGRKIRYYACGEYGENFERPHFHACIFNFDFPDKSIISRKKGSILYSSEILERLWGNGVCAVGSLTFDSAAYVARYCTKKVTGDLAADHYQGRLPERPWMSCKPGIGADWYRKYKKDCFPSDFVVVNGVRSKIPRYYDKLLEREDPSLFLHIKQSREEVALSDDDDSTHRRLLDREKCMDARLNQLVRNIERSYV